jgi:hypothetical protein
MWIEMLDERHVERFGIEAGRRSWIRSGREVVARRLLLVWLEDVVLD